MLALFSGFDRQLRHPVFARMKRLRCGSAVQKSVEKWLKAVDFHTVVCAKLPAVRISSNGQQGFNGFSTALPTSQSVEAVRLAAKLATFPHYYQYGLLL